MSLKKINVASEKTASASKSSVPVFSTTSRNITRFVVAHRDMAEAKAVLDEVKNEVEDLGLQKLFAHNVANNGAPASSIKLTDGDNTVMVTLQNRYSQPNEDAAVALFESLGEDANNHVHFVTKSSFDDKVFLKDGQFQDDVFAAFKAGVEELAKKLNIASPIKTQVVVSPKENFHAQRWSKFSVEQQARIQEVVRGTVAVKPA